MPPRPVGPVADKALRVGARIIDLIIEVLLAAVALLAFGDQYRFWTSMFVVWLALSAYETIATTLFGATLGKRAVGLKVVELDRLGTPTWGASLRRCALMSLLMILPPAGLVGGLAVAVVASAAGGVTIMAATTLTCVAMALSAFGDPLGRGLADRSATTMVVPRRYTRVVSTHDLAGFADGARPPRIVPAGRVGDADVRVRARLRRLDNSRVLAGAIAILALAASIPLSSDDPSDNTQTWAILATSVAWVIVFVINETRLITSKGATPGHEQAGLRIVNRKDLQAPRTPRSFARALTLALSIYVPVLWPFAAISLIMMRVRDDARGLHDLAGGTLVISDPRLSGERQRQLAMAMRLGRVS